MATRVDVLNPAPTTAPVAGKAVAADFARLVGLAFVLSLALGLVLTAAAVAIPAPLAGGEAPLLRCEKPMDADPDAVRAQVIALGLEHQLVTPHTSLVAVDVTPARPEDAAPRAHAVPSSLPHGWAFETQWGLLPQTATPAPLHAAIAVIALPFAALTRASRKSRPAKRTAAGPGLC